MLQLLPDYMAQRSYMTQLQHGGGSSASIPLDVAQTKDMYILQS